jgi:hypothetical protein
LLISSFICTILKAGFSSVPHHILNSYTASFFVPLWRVKTPVIFIVCAVVFCTNISTKTYASDYKKTDFSMPRHYAPSTAETGMIGLNTIPSARMDEKGTIRLGMGTSDPYRHSFMGFQLSKSFYVSLRQTEEISSFTDAANAYYPGVDLKIRLVEETATRPAIALGVDSALGHKRMASEYLTFSKRYHNFDFTGGMAWGRLGSAGHMKNPLRGISSHFDTPRNYNTQTSSQNIGDWFTGEDVGFFGGVEYFTPLKGLSIKADYGASDYIGENIISGFDTPEPWALSFNYKPIDQIDLSAGVIGGDKFIARISLQDKIINWMGRPSSPSKSPDLITPRAQGEGSDEAMLNLSPYTPTAQQMGQTVRIVSNNAAPDAQKITVALRHKGLNGPVVTLMRSDLERAILNNQGSPEEIWRNSIIEKDTSSNFDWKKLLQKDLFKKNNYKHAFKFILDQKISLLESDTGILYRTAGMIEGEKIWPFGVISGASGRVNIANNLKKLKEHRFRDASPVRSDEDLFSSNRFGIDRFYSTWIKSLSPSTHIALSGGYLEEMYGGYGGEILYRPFGKRFAIGAEGWRTYKRDPNSTLSQVMTSEGNYTGHLNLFYEFPPTKNANMSAYLKIGKYLREDVGGTFGLKNVFDNGTSLEGYITTTDQADADIIGNSTHAFGGIRLNLPLGNIPFVPSGSEMRFTTQPLARDSGQILDNPQSLYNVTEPIAYRSLSQSWKNLLD